MIETRDLCNNETTVNANDMKSFVTLSGYLDSVTLNKTPGLTESETSAQRADHGDNLKTPSNECRPGRGKYFTHTSDVDELLLRQLGRTVNTCLYHDSMRTNS